MFDSSCDKVPLQSHIFAQRPSKVQKVDFTFIFTNQNLQKYRKSALPSFLRVKTSKGIDLSVFQYTQVDFTFIFTSQYLKKYRSFRFFVYTSRRYPHFYESKPPKVQIFPCLTCKNEGKPTGIYTQFDRDSFCIYFQESKAPKGNGT